MIRKFLQKVIKEIHFFRFGDSGSTSTCINLKNLYLSNLLDMKDFAFKLNEYMSVIGDLKMVHISVCLPSIPVQKTL